MNSQRKLLIIIIATILIVFVAYKSSHNVVSGTTSLDAKLLPELEKNIDNVGTVIIRSKGKSFKVKLENGQCVMPNKYSYSIGIEKIMDLVQNSANIKIIEKKFKC